MSDIPPAPPPAVPPAPPAPPTPPAPPAPPVPPPDRPDGVTDAEWNALGDPGKAALVRERARATAAEQALAAARKPPAPPPPPPSASAPPKAHDVKPGDQTDIAAIVRDSVAQAVAAAIAPIQQRDAEREAQQAAEAIRGAVTAAATPLLFDASDALAHIDLTTVTDGTGKADPAKVTAALDDLLKRKPHLGRAVDPRRRAAPGAGVGAAGDASAPLDDRVKATLARMQAASGVKFADA